jgi:hypothetical protein
MDKKVRVFSNLTVLKSVLDLIYSCLTQAIIFFYTYVR